MFTMLLTLSLTDVALAGHCSGGHDEKSDSCSVNSYGDNASSCRETSSDKQESQLVIAKGDSNEVLNYTLDEGSEGISETFTVEEDGCPLLGDVNGDSSVNVQDVILAINLVLSNEYNISADLNFDDTVDVIDIVQLVNIILN